MIIIQFVLLSLYFHNSFTGDVGDTCTFNDNESEAKCVLIIDCPIALKEIKSKNFHKLKRCGFKGLTEIVCCPKETVDKFVMEEASRRLMLKSPHMTTGTTAKREERISDRECKKIVENSIPPLDLHIIGGETASPGEFPHMVGLGYDAPDGLNFQCGGTLLSNTYVLTAAHCVDTIDRILPAVVRMGVMELTDTARNNETDVDITTIIKHPDYTRRQKYHDLALLKLAQAVQFSTYLNPVCLYTSLEDPKIPLTVTGWGKTSNTKNIRSNILLKANVTVVSRDKCGESYSSWRKLPNGISDGQLCAGDPLGEKDTCQGDSGGPLQGLTESDGYYRLVGVTSFGRGCGSSVPGVYTRVAKYLDWIESVVWPK